MKLLVVSDEESKYIWDYFDKNRFKDIEIIFSCGDLKQEYLSFLVSMINAPLYYVHGNHDTDYRGNPPEGCESIEDKVVSYKGLRIAGLGGCFKYGPGDFHYTEKQMRWRILKLKPKIWLHNGIDILLTHAPVYKLGDGDDYVHKGFECFINFMEVYKPKYLFHGHQHLNYGRNERIHRYNNTKIINGFGYYIVEF
ncbi:metallophosphoesterase family protein [Paenibacillus contaminans]|uniref:Metallophosphoesterase n=1 Tax=Paenibacillus contaminans TaxID=450362 RepID=A0A329M1J4_9BACL|nr:metallophosphoesterase [Paenibacillus contaminans]RAV13580.1 metallophosphoesterase [Paenibacillus contaminans]